ncbi:MAG: cyclase [Nitrospinae bacterium CG11_big_fil_rev_8_21_14_0_20_56_8]|nr:MAG: cyclase [Nitrospinae bacterium CG11_big_fil_rev_8_21_14_0_20_56_8]
MTPQIFFMLPANKMPPLMKQVHARNYRRIFFGLLFSALVPILGPNSSAQAEKRIIDLTHPFDETTLYWPTNKSFHLDSAHRGRTEKGYWYESNDYSASEHGGTHLDAPAHFAENRWHVDDIPLDRLIGPGVVVDLRFKTMPNPDYLIRAEDFHEWEHQFGTILENSIVLVLTGWDQYWPSKKDYLGTDLPGDVEHLHFPGFSEDAARFLARDRKVSAVGLDTPSLDYGQSKDFKAHRVFGEANVPGFENLHQLGALPTRGFRVIALPMKIGKGSGAPLRIVAELD